MDNVTFWKNFNLGTELQLSGSFVYNGLHSFNQMQNFYNEEDIFEFLYNISIGIERLEKIAIILIEHDSDCDQEEFEKSLFTHNHSDLLIRIKKHHKLNLGTIQNEFIGLLSKFYKSYRYDRYCLAQVTSYDKEKKEFEKFLTKHLKDEIKEMTRQEIINNSLKIKHFVGKTVGNIVTELYRVVREEAMSKNIYTYEIRSCSKAYKIFMSKEFDFTKEAILWKELLIHLIHSESSSGIVSFIKEIEPLNFDSGLNSEYLDCFQNDIKKSSHMDELDALYDEDVENKGERLKMLDVIGNPCVHFESDIEDE